MYLSTEYLFFLIMKLNQMQKKDLPAIRFDPISQLGLNRELPFLHTGLF